MMALCDYLCCNSSVEKRERFDHLCDCIPLVSTITNLAVLILKIWIVIANIECDVMIDDHGYFHYSKNKDIPTCIICLFPIIGNIWGIHNMREAIKDYHDGKRFENRDLDLT